MHFPRYSTEHRVTVRLGSVGPRVRPLQLQIIDQILIIVQKGKLLLQGPVDLRAHGHSEVCQAAECVFGWVGVCVLRIGILVREGPERIAGQIKELMLSRSGHYQEWIFGIVVVADGCGRPRDIVP